MLQAVVPACGNGKATRIREGVDLRSIVLSPNEVPSTARKDEAFSGILALSQLIQRLPGDHVLLSPLLTRSTVNEVYWRRYSGDPLDHDAYLADSFAVLFYDEASAVNALSPIQSVFKLPALVVIPSQPLGADAFAAETPQLQGVSPGYFFVWRRGPVILSLGIKGKGGPPSARAALMVALGMDERTRMALQGHE